MKHQILLPFFIWAFCISSLVNAQVVTNKAAREAAFRFLSSKNIQLSGTPDDFIEVAVPGINVSAPEVYIFNHPQGGFIILSGDRSASPVIGYSDKGFIPAAPWRSNFDFWIQNAVAQIQFYRQSTTKATTAIEEEWSYLFNESSNNPFVSSKAILPFLRSIWSQDGSFNDMCPEDSQGEALVGCVATAMAQVIYYYEYPKTGNGSHSYYATGYGNQSVNYSNTTYKYEEMMGDVLFPTPEVAKLSYHCGVAVNMSYGFTASGSFTNYVPDALTSHFRYSTDAEYHQKMFYSSTSWATLMRTNLDAYHPVIYSGSGSGGHAFVMDGYEGTNHFHFDWGWGGSANGLYYLDALNPAGNDFSDDQACVESIYPLSTAYPYGCTGTTTLTSTFGTIEDGSGPTANYEDNGNCSWLINPVAQCDNFKITFEQIDLATGDSIKIYAGPNSSAPLSGAFSGSTLPAAFNVDGSQVFISFITNASNNSKGFLLHYVGHIPLGCTGIQSMTNPTDTFDDGSASNHYGNSSFCRWNIQPPGATSITLHFMNFSMADEYDYVRVVDAATSSTVAEYYKGDNPTSVTVNSYKMTVVFQSNTSLVADGFQAYYSITTDIDDQPAGLSFRVYPNPASDFINIVPGDEAAGSLLVIYDFSGRCLFSERTDGSTVLFPAGHLAPGLYSVGLLSDKGNVWQKVVIE